MEPKRTDNESDEVDEGEGTTAPGHGRIRVLSPSRAVSWKMMRQLWTAHRLTAAVSLWWSEKLAWGTGQAGIAQNRLRDCFLKSQILHVAFSVPSMATCSCSPIQKTLKKMLDFFYMCPYLASCRLPWSLSSVAFFRHSYSTSIGLSIKVIPQGTPRPSEGPGLLQGFVHTLIT